MGKKKFAFELKVYTDSEGYKLETKPKKNRKKERHVRRERHALVKYKSNKIVINIFRFGISKCFGSE